MKKLILSLFILLTSALTASVSARSTVYTGTIGTYKIHMVLDENDKGYYYYDHRPQSRFTLVKTRESECDECMHCVHMTLQEYVPGTNKNTGEFVGKYRFCKDGGIAIVSIEGTFRNKTTGKTLPFEVSYSYEYQTYY
jgi:Pyruvate/2-oxoacid:ferredoxin oxidoreductase delta subunit